MNWRQWTWKYIRFQLNFKISSESEFRFILFFIFFLLFHEFKHYFFPFPLPLSLFSFHVEHVYLNQRHSRCNFSCKYKLQFMRSFRHQCLELDLRNNFSLLKRFKVENRVIIASYFFCYYFFRVFRGVFRFIYRVEWAKKENLVLSLFLCFLCSFFFVDQIVHHSKKKKTMIIFIILNAPKPLNLIISVPTVLWSMFHVPWLRILYFGMTFGLSICNL